MKPQIILALVFAGCGTVTEVDEPVTARRGSGDTVLLATGGATGAAGMSGAGGATGAAGAGVGGAPAPVASTYDCAATAPVQGTPNQDRPYTFVDFGLPCTRGGGECALTQDWKDRHPSPSAPLYAETCSSDILPAMPTSAVLPPVLPGRGFCTTALPPRAWDTSCQLFAPNQIPTGWQCCESAGAASVFVPSDCGCPR